MRYLLTSITWPYHRLRFRANRGQVFSEVDCWPGAGFPLDCRLKSGYFSGEKEGVRAEAKFWLKLTPGTLLTFLPTYSFLSWKVPYSGVPVRWRRVSRAPYLRKFGNPSISKLLVVTWLSVHPYVRTPVYQAHTLKNESSTISIFISSILDIYVILNDSCYSLTSIRWPYRGLRSRAHQCWVFFGSWPLTRYLVFHWITDSSMVITLGRGREFMQRQNFGAN